MQTTVSRRRTALSVSCTTHVVQDGLIATIYVLLPVLAEALGFSYAQVGLLKGLKSVSQAVLEMCSGWLSEQIGELRLIVVGLALSGTGYILLSAATSAPIIATFLLIIGTGTALHHAPSSSLIINNCPTKKRGSSLGLYNAAGDVGKLVFTGGFSLAAGAGLAWYEISFGYGVMAIVAAIAITAVSRPIRQQWNKEEAAESNNGEQVAAAGWGILNWRSFGALLVVTCIDTLVQTSVLVFMAFLLLAKGLPLSIATGGTVILLAGGVFGKTGCGYLADRMGVRPAFTLIQVLTALGLICVIIAPNWLALSLLLPLGAVAQGSTSITYAFAADLIHPRRMARGYALLYASGTFAAAAGPVVLGLIADEFGIETAIYTMALITIFTVPPIFVLPTVPDQEAELL
ncbi:MFS transporter [Roseovarius aestuarii]|uniref:Putative sulfoacetate transporter SauU n=1 Tax=Roseovarius aestuarii TaxID=475083 RepID=A0A1X7BWU1_9RHOB|nr:MFS transporter [Roseovarius aestuarii]SMC14111.1 putative sulfoacetate transporter SauU [Roseovarius aestuarii]